MLLLIGFLSVALADEPVALTALPAPVTASIAAQWPTAHAVSAEKDDGEFEVVLTDGARKFEVKFKADGTHVETEEKVDAASLPAAVRTAATARGKILRAEVSTPAGGASAYEIVVSSHGKEVELHVDAAGKITKEEAEDEEHEGDEEHEKGEKGEKEDDDRDEH